MDFDDFMTRSALAYDIPFFPLFLMFDANGDGRKG